MIFNAVKNFFSDGTNRWMAGIFVAAAYLMLFNLGSAPLWHDEGSSGLMGKMFLKTGSLSAWDGRTLHVGDNGVAANSDLIVASYPPWPMLPSALGIAVFGPNEVGVRFFHALLGVFSLLVFWQLLYLDFAARARLRLLVFALFALSTQVILFARLGRYVPDALFFALLNFYAYRLYIAPGGRLWHLALAAVAVLLGFLNHFAVATSFALALGVWHLLFHFRSTTLRQWIELAVAAVLVAALCLLYLWSLKIILSDENLEFSSTFYKTPLVERKWILISQNFRDMVRFGLLPMWAALWFVCIVLYTFYRRFSALPIGQVAQAAVDAAGKKLTNLKEMIFLAGKKRKKKKKKGKEAAEPSMSSLAPMAPMDRDLTVIIRWAVLGALFLLFSGLLSVREPLNHGVADSRYIAPILIFSALICGAMVDWLWSRPWCGKYIALLTLTILLSSNLLSYPYVFTNIHTKRPIDLRLPNLIMEVHRSFNNYLRQTVDYLRAHAKPGETISVFPWQEFTVMQVYFSDELVFCCLLNDKSPLPRHKVRALDIPLYVGDVLPDWWVVVNNKKEEIPGYELVHTATFYAYPTQRPELEFHAFEANTEAEHLMWVYRKKEDN